MAVAGRWQVGPGLCIGCLEPAFAGGTGTPELGSLGSNQVPAMLEEFADLRYAGKDCVVVAPACRSGRVQEHGAGIRRHLAGRVAEFARAGSHTGCKRGHRWVIRCRKRCRAG
jgi:hypothetical protein